MNSRTRLVLATPLLAALASCENLELNGEWEGTYEPAAVPAGVVVNHTPLSEQQIAQLESTYGVRVVCGDYWYDSHSGLFGAMGQPSQGQLYAGHEFGPVPRDASLGTSGVLLNGRELHYTEVSYLAHFTGPVAPGAYWMDGYGNLGYEGVPTPAANLYALIAASNQQPSTNYGGSNDNTWSSMTGNGNYNADNSSGYVHIPSTTGGSGVFVSY